MALGCLRWTWLRGLHLSLLIGGQDHLRAREYLFAKLMDYFIFSLVTGGDCQVGYEVFEPGRDFSYLPYRFSSNAILCRTTNKGRIEAGAVTSLNDKVFCLSP